MAEKIIYNNAKGMKKIYSWEPWFFMFFGLFHLHRIWALADRESYASFWMGIMENKGIAYFGIMESWLHYVFLELLHLSRIERVIIGGDGYTYLVAVMSYLIYLQLQPE